MRLTKGQGISRNGDGTLGVTIDDPEDPSGETSLNLTYDDNYNIVDKKKYRNVPDEDTPRRQHTGGKQTGQQSQSRNAINKRNARTKPGDQMQLVEEFTDKPIELDEKDVEEVFALLYPAEKPQTPDDKKQADLEKLKKLIKTGMSTGQRKALWKALNESMLFEQYVDSNDVKELFNQARQLRSGALSIETLRQAWKNSGYPTDTSDIAAILRTAGFGEKEIEQVFNQVLGDYEDDGNDEEYVDDEEDTPSSPALIKIAEYVKKNGLRDELVAFLQDEFGEELSDIEEPEPKKSMFDRAKEFGKKMFNRKATTEEVRQIFTAILLEERTMLSTRIKEQEKSLLGRSRK